MTEDDKKELGKILAEDLKQLGHQRDHERDHVETLLILAAIMIIIVCTMVNLPLFAAPAPLFPELGKTVVNAVRDMFGGGDGG